MDCIPILASPEIWAQDLSILGVGEWEATVASILFQHWAAIGHDPQEISLTFQTVKEGTGSRPLSRVLQYAWKEEKPVLTGWVNKSRLMPATGTGSVLGDLAKYVLSSWSSPPDMELAGVVCKNPPHEGYSVGDPQKG